MSDASRNVEILKQAYSSWAKTKGASADQWLSICADNICFGSLAQGPAGAQYLTAFQERNALKDYFAGLSQFPLAWQAQALRDQPRLFVADARVAARLDISDGRLCLDALNRASHSWVIRSLMTAQWPRKVRRRVSGGWA